MLYSNKAIACILKSQYGNLRFDKNNVHCVEAIRHDSCVFLMVFLFVLKIPRIDLYISNF